MPLTQFSNVLNANQTQKPTGKVTIDWNNGLTHRMVGCWAFAYPGDISNLVNGRSGVIQGTLHDPIYTSNQYGPCWQGATFNTQGTYNYIRTLPLGSTHLANNANFSVFVLVNRENASEGSVFNSCIYAERAASGNNLLTLGVDPSTSNTQLYFAYRNDAGSILLMRSANNVVPQGRFVFVGLTKSNGTNGCRMFAGGALVQTATWGGANDTFTNANLAANIGRDETEPSSWAGKIGFVAIWTRALSDSEHLSLATRPWQFLISAEYEMPVLFSAPSFISGWSLQSNLPVIGGGTF